MYCAVELTFLLLKDTGQHNCMLQAGEACIFRNIQAAVQNQPNPVAIKAYLCLFGRPIDSKLLKFIHFSSTYYPDCTAIVVMYVLYECMTWMYD